MQTVAPISEYLVFGQENMMHFSMHLLHASHVKNGIVSARSFTLRVINSHFLVHGLRLVCLVKYLLVSSSRIAESS